MENELMQRLIERYLSAHHTFAVDLPNGMKAGEVLRLRGKSVFEKKEKSGSESKITVKRFCRKQQEPGKRRIRKNSGGRIFFYKRSNLVVGE